MTFNPHAYLTLDAVEGDYRPTDYRVFRDMSAFRSYIEHAPNHERGCEYTNNVDPEFYGRGWSSAVSALAYGSTDNVALSERFASKVAHLTDWSARTFEVQSGVVGSALNMGAYLSGAPNMLRRRVRVETQAAPLHVVVTVNSASTVSTDALINRGAAALALVRTLAVSRPVTLWASVVSGASPHNVAVLVKVDTAPMSVAHAAFILADVAFGRRLMFAARHMCSPLAVSHSYPPVGENAKLVGRRICAGILSVPSADCIYLPRPSGAEPELRDPIKWLTVNLAEYGRPAEGEE